MKSPAIIYLVRAKDPLSKSFNDGHLVPIKKQVNKGGKIFEQTKWVKPEDAKKHVRPGAVWQIKDMPGVHAAHANKHLQVLSKDKKLPDHYNVQYENGEKGTIHHNALLRFGSVVHGHALEAKSTGKMEGQQLFDQKELADITGSGRQPITDKDKLYEASKESLDHMKSWLDMGKGIADQLGFETMTGGMDDVDWSKEGGMLFIAPLKGEKRAAEKVEQDYGGDWSKLCDVVRGSMAVDSMEDVQKTVEALKKAGLKLAKPPKDRFSKPTSVGYRDLLLNVEFPNGTIGELQIHVKPMLQAKELGHKPYESIRTIEGKYTDADGKVKPVSEWKAGDYRVWNEAVKASRMVYQAGWKQVIQEPAHA